MYTISPLLVKFDKKQIKKATGFEYDDIVEMAMRIGIKEKYSYIATSCDGVTTATYEVNMDPVLQILIPSSCRMPYDYLEFLRDTSPISENPETNLIKSNTYLFIDGSRLKISSPTGSIEGDDIHYSGEDKISCFRHQTLCDSNGLILGLFGPAEDRIPDKRLFDKSGLALDLSQFKLGGEYLQCFSDAGYIGVTTPMGQFTCFFKPPQNATLTPEQKLFNKQHSKIKLVAEKCFANVSYFWKGVSEKFTNRYFVIDLSMKTAVSMFIVNCHLVCYRGCTNLKLFETHDNGKTYQSTRLIDLGVYINQWIKHEICLDHIYCLQKRLMLGVHYNTITFDNLYENE